MILKGQGTLKTRIESSPEVMEETVENSVDY